MSINNSIRENFILLLSDMILKKQVSRKLTFLMESQFWNEEKLVKFQKDRLHLLVNHVYQNVPYYTKLFKRLGLTPSDFKNLEDLRKLPIMNKDNVREAIKSGELISRNINKKVLLYNSSSGSTGEPLQFYETKTSDSIKKAAALRGWYWMGYRLGDKFIKVSQIPRNSILKKIQDVFTNSLYLHIPQINDGSFANIIEQIEKFNPKFLRIYPDPLNLLVGYMKKEGIRINSITAINTTGSILTPEVRANAEDVFNCKIYDGFSCEGGAVVFECPTHECYHSAMEQAFTEVLDNKGNPAIKGRLITTDLWNFATPFIRYDTQDIVELGDHPCNCERALMPVKQIYGRESDILITPSGQYLIVNNFTGHFQWINEVEQFQVHQHLLNKFVVYLKVNSSYSKSTESLILSILKSIIKEDVEIIIQLVNEIPLSKSGKRRFLIRNDEVKLPHNA